MSELYHYKHGTELKYTGYITCDDKMLLLHVRVVLDSKKLLSGFSCLRFYMKRESLQIKTKYKKGRKMNGSRFFLITNIH